MTTRQHELEPIPRPAGGNNHGAQRYPRQTRENGRAEVRFQDYVMLIRRGRWTIAITAASVFLLIAGYTFLTKPVYEATARVIIETKARGEGPQSFLDLLGSSATTKITNEIEILRANSLTEAVGQSLVKKKFVNEASGKRIKIIEAAQDSSGAPVYAPLRQIAERLNKTLDYVPIKESDVIKIVARNVDPQEAALIANTVAEVYVKRNLDMSRSRSRAIKEFLADKLQEKQGSLSGAESALQTYMKNSGVVSLEGADKRVVEQLSQLEGTRDALDVEISARKQTLASLRDELAKQEPNAARSITQSNDAYVRQLQEHLAQLEVQRDVLVAQNPDMQGQRIFSDKLKELNGQIDALRKNLERRTKEFLTALQPGDLGITAREGSAGFLAGLKQKIIEQQIELDGLNARRAALTRVVKDYEGQFNRIPQKSMELAKLQRSRLSSEKLYLMVEEKYNEAAITETSELGYVNVFDPAIEPDDPVSPKVLLNLIVGIVAGLGLGIGVVLVRSAVVVVIHSPEDIKKLGYTLLAIVSRMDSRFLDAPSAHQRNEGKGTTRDPYLATLHQPFSPIAESYRHLRTSIEYVRPDHPVRSLVVTSPMAGEGKSTTAANLAIACSQLERKVLLVDADMRKPRIHELFGLVQDLGLAQLLKGDKEITDVIVEEVCPRLDVILSGPLPLNPAELLSSKRMSDFLQYASRRYDVTILDAPPVLDVTDAVVMGPKVDGTILVISSGTSRVDVLERATEVMERLGSGLLGVVLNRFDPLQSYGGGYGKRGYGYGYYASASQVRATNGRR